MNTCNQKCQLKDPSNISITWAPQAPKKTQKKPIPKGTDNLAMTQAPNMILPTLISNPTAQDAALPPITNASTNITNQVPKCKQASKKGKKDSTATTLAETLQGPHENAPPKPKSTGNA
ncbi:hypothetical protein OPQ81_000550 [Rhizoctonia solani]|nr:hypothetical protein OPQ81_000550 [Rhizoctonia solani]